MAAAPATGAADHPRLGPSMPLYETSVDIPAARAHLFEFLIRPANIEKLAPPEAELTFLDAPDVLELGVRFEFQVSGIGPAQRMTHEVTHFEPSSSFTETQVKGPLKLYRHEHILEATSESITRIVDRIEFEPPGGIAGFLVTEQWIRKSFETGFEHRHNELKRLLAAPQ